MLGMGMSLVIDDFKRVLVFPKAVILGLVGQILILPVLAFILVKWFDAPAIIAVGIMLIAACPGGTSSNLISHLAKGDTALSISLTAITSLVTVVSIPLILGFSMDYFLAAHQVIELPVVKTIMTLIAITFLPVSLGMLIRKKYTQFALNQETRINALSGLFLACLVLLIVWQQSHAVKEGIVAVGWLVASLNVLSMFVGFLIGRIFQLSSSQTTTIAIEVGVQNGTLAILIAATILQQAVFALPAAIYSLSMFISGFMVIFWRQHRKH